MATFNGMVVEQSTNGTTWTVIPKIKVPNIPNVTYVFADGTTVESGDYEEKIIVGFVIDDLTMTGNYTPDLFDEVFGQITAKTLMHYRFTLPKLAGQTTTGDRWQYTAYPTISVTNGGVRNLVEFELMLTYSGPNGLIFTPGT